MAASPIFSRSAPTFMESPLPPGTLPPGALPVFNPAPTIGALQIGTLISYAIFGVTTTQTYIYYSRFPEDQWKLKALVAFVWLCEFAHAICIGHTLYTYTITDYGHPERLILRVPETLEVAIFFSGIIAATVQGFFSFRIYILSRKLYIPCATWLLSATRLALSMVAFASGLRMATVPSYEAEWGWVAISLWSSSSANDVIIAATLVYLFSRQRNDLFKTRRTAALVDKLIAWTIETGTMTSVFGVVTLACYVTMKENFIWIALLVITARLFSNSLLASLNSRVTLRALNEVSLTPAITLSTRSNVDSETAGMMFKPTRNERNPYLQGSNI